MEVHMEVHGRTLNIYLSLMRPPLPLEEESALRLKYSMHQQKGSGFANGAWLKVNIFKTGHSVPPTQVSPET